MPKPTEKKQFIDYYANKHTPEKLASFLFDARTRCEDGWAHRMNVRENELSNIAEQNQILKKLLTDCGIPIQHLIIKYTDSNCAICGWAEDDECLCDEFGFVCPKRHETGTFNFYTYNISLGILTGISSDLKKIGLTVEKVFDGRTGECLYDIDDDDAVEEETL